jgi:N-methylhydantoinase A
MRVATDIGGTFTDLVCLIDSEDGTSTGELRIAKVDTTVVINALTERKGARTALITTRGFRDVLEIARGNRPDLFNLRYRKPPPLISRSLRHELTERVDCNGRILIPLDRQELEALARTLQRERVEAVGICFLHSYRNQSNEREAERTLRELLPDVAVVRSTAITREWREYERSNTVAAAAFVQRTVETYLDRLEKLVRQHGFQNTAYVMRSNGGVDTLNASRSKGITMVESGPAGGVFGAAALGELIGQRDLIALDIGGTTAKCSLIADGRVGITTSYSLEKTRRYAGYPLLVPTVDIVEIGNGGGSIAWLDEAGKLHVGPQSAGAEPGPAAYGRGGEQFTTTDAHVLTGRIDPDYFLGGRIAANLAAVRKAAQGLSQKLGVSVEEVGRGVLRIADANMVNALRLVSLNRGYDPRKFVLVAFGGGGGLHATSLARKLQIPTAIVPVNSSVFSAWGMLLANLRRDYVVNNVLSVTDDAHGELGKVLERIEHEASGELSRDGLDTTSLRFDRLLDMRYEGQEHTVKVTCPFYGGHLGSMQDLLATFRREYQREFSYSLPNPVEIVNVHVVAYLPVGRWRPRSARSTGSSVAQCVKGKRRVDLDELGTQEATVYDRSRLEAGMEIAAPAIIEEPETTTVVDSGHAKIDELGNICIAL